MFKKILIFLLLTINTYAFLPILLKPFIVDIPVGNCALVVASAKYKSEMKNYINTHNIKNYTIYKTKNKGWYSLSLGNINYKNRHKIISELIENKKIPSDSYCSKSNKFSKKVTLSFMPDREDISAKSFSLSEKNDTQLNSHNSDKKEIDNVIDIENKVNISTEITKLLNELSKHIDFENKKFYNLDKNITILNNAVTGCKHKVTKSLVDTKNNLELKIITNYINETEKKLEKTNQQLREIRFKLPDNFNYIAEQSKIYSLIQENNLTKIDRNLTTINSKILDIYNRLNKINRRNNLIKTQKPLLGDDINLTNLNYQKSFTEINKKMENLLKVENMFESFSINENIDLFFAEINDENKYNSKFIYELYLYGCIFFIFILLTFFILRFNNDYINQEIIYIEEPKSLMDVDENAMSKLIASRVFSYTEQYDTKIVLFKNTVLLIGIIIFYFILFYFWYSYIHKFDRLNMLEEYKYKIQLEQTINNQILQVNQNIENTKLKLNKYSKNTDNIGLKFNKHSKDTDKVLNGFNNNFREIQVKMNSLFIKKKTKNGKGYIWIPKFTGSKSIDVDIAD